MSAVEDLIRLIHDGMRESRNEDGKYEFNYDGINELLHQAYAIGYRKAIEDRMEEEDK